MVFETVAAVKAGGKAMEMTGGMIKHFARHPIVYGTIGLAAVLGATYGARGFVASYVDVEMEQETTVESPGRGEITEIDLDIQERPIVGFTAEVSDAKTTISNNLRVGLFGKEINIPQGNNSITWGGVVDTTINYDPSQIEALYDPGMLDDDTDDQITVRVPLEAFSVTPSVQPEGQTLDANDDMLGFFKNASEAWTESWSALKSVPGVSHMAKASSQGEQTAVAYTQVNVLKNVAEQCTPKVAKEPTVYDAIRARIAEDAMLAVGKSTDEALQALTIKQINNMETVVQIGAETADEPVITGQKLSTENEFTKRVAELNELEGVDLGSGGDFECEISDEVRDQLKNTSTPPTKETPATPDGSAAQQVAKEATS